MASNINPYNVDGTFPIAGQDNPSQGFRDNFTNIKNNFLYAQNEITDLQGKTILSGALAGQTLNNDMAGTQITRPQLKAWTQSMIDLGTVSSSIVLDFNHYILLFMKCNAMYSKFMICHTVFFKFLFSVAQFGLPTAYVTSVLAYIKLKAWNFVVWQVKMMRTRA